MRPCAQSPIPALTGGTAIDTLILLALAVAILVSVVLLIGQLLVRRQREKEQWERDGRPETPPALPSATAPAGVTSAAIEMQRAPVTILISIDGFHPDYLKRGLTPNLSRLAAGGVTGPMRPSFPSKTFPK